MAMIVDQLSLSVWFLLTLAIVLVVESMHRRRKRLPLPPGPKPLPIVGNMFDMPQGAKPWIGLSEWSRVYS